MKIKHVTFLMMGLLLLLTGCSTMTPLSRASSRGDIGAMKDLIQKGVNLNEPGETSYKATALHWAASNGREEAVRTLLAAGANINSQDYCRQTPIFYAVNSQQGGKAATVGLLIDKGADMSLKDCNGWMPVDYARENQDKVLLDLIMSKSPVSAERVQKAKLAEGKHLNLPWDITNCRVTEAHLAAKKGDMKALKALIAAGADLDEVDCHGFRADEYARGTAEVIDLIASKTSTSHKGDHHFPNNIRWEDSINFNNAVPKINYQGSKKISIVVHDQRKYILDKEKQPEYVGYTRHTAVAPKDLITRDRKPFCETLATLIAAGYRKANFEIVSSNFIMDKNAKEGIGQNKSDRTIIFRVNELITETQYWSGYVDFKYDILTTVVNEQGKELYSQTFTGQEIIGADKSSPVMRTLVVVPEVLYYLLTDICNKPELKSALL
ncbi:MAG: ankyrin repeat domain-containing protein [Deltaproteobacteria bacterium]